MPFDGLFVFDLANNHQGDVRHGLGIIEAVGRLAREHGIRSGIKFQYRHLDTFIHPRFKGRADVPHVSRFLGTRLNDDEFRTLVDAVRDNGLVPICTPFDERSVDLALSHEIEILKVASSSADDWPLLEAISDARKPTICSTGGRSIQEIDNVVSFMTHREVDLALMHCVSLYPTPPEAAQLNFMTRMMRRYPYVPVGYSGHESAENLDVVKNAVARGAVILERHVGIPTDSIRINPYSMTPDQTGRWIAAALEARRIGGGANEKTVSKAEADSIRSLSRGAYATRSLRKGEPILREDACFLMPCADGQTTSGEYHESMIASRDYEEMEALYERRPPNLITEIRSVIHDAKGILCEASIELGSNFTIELSHHLGMEHFRRVGAFLVTVVNREYCKRLVVMLPGQEHPAHFHRKKEETFHVLWGDIQITLEGEDRALKRGDQVLIPRGAIHSFGSRNGGVFEELSTKHFVGDSEYLNERIKKLDPMQRKTFLDSW